MGKVGREPWGADLGRDASALNDILDPVERQLSPKEVEDAARERRRDVGLEGEEVQMELVVDGLARGGGEGGEARRDRIREVSNGEWVGGVFRVLGGLLVCVRSDVPW